MLLYQSGGNNYAFCGEFCLHQFQRVQAGEPSGLQPVTEPQPGVSFGCWWCGGDVTVGLGIDWQDKGEANART